MTVTTVTMVTIPSTAGAIGYHISPLQCGISITVTPGGALRKNLAAWD